MLIREIKPFVRNAFVLNTVPKNDNVKAFDNRIFYVVKGCGNIILEGKKYAFGRGSAIMLRPGVEYCWQVSLSTEFKLVVINYDYTMKYSHITSFFTPCIAEMFEEKDIIEKVFFEDAEQLNEPVVIDNVYIIENELLDITEEFEKKQLFYIESISGKLNSIIVQLLRMCIVGKMKSSNKIDIILTYISENYRKEISNETLAKLINYHPNYINYLMKKYNGCTLHSYLINFRLNKSLKKLIHSNLSIEEIAYEIGFKNSTHFCKAFKKQFGMSPASYRKNTNYI